MNSDLLSKILLCLSLPFQSLLRLRVVCKFWRDVIDSPDFKKLHTLTKADDPVHIQVSFLNVVPNQLSIRFQHNMKLLMSCRSDHFNGFSLYYGRSDYLVRLVGEVKGLIGINPTGVNVPVAICNPYLGQLKFLPLTTSSDSLCVLVERSVAIGFDEDYKVAQLMWCYKHRGLHAQLYSRRTDSWRELADGGILDDLTLYSIQPIKSACKNGSFAYWRVNQRVNGDIVPKILSLDMRKEVFRTITLPSGHTGTSSIFVEDEHSFRMFEFMNNRTIIFYSRCEGRQVMWKQTMGEKLPSDVPSWSTSFVFLEHEGFEVAYDYRARELICKLSEDFLGPKVVEFRATLISP
ncbi:F-box/kelch-repeat protein-like protein [Salvia divinorum]|uniref:F-box/kelch-repeat protein-like protein n=1 Tax=Salvia divinorum TaxID=28513 RepID=A0ABD1GEX8_SALDI